jgi:tRNA pseudouridine synthase 10
MTSKFPAGSPTGNEGTEKSDKSVTTNTTNTTNNTDSSDKTNMVAMLASITEEYGPICDHCLGRLVAKRSFGLSNDERGRAIRIYAALVENKPYVPFLDGCWVCGDLFDCVDAWALRVRSALEGIECSTFLMGSRTPPLMNESEEMLWTDFSLFSPEPIKSEINREFGKAVSKITNLVVEFSQPDVVVLVDLAADEIEVQIRSLFLAGRYFKYERGIPQTHWPCRACQGVGCEVCGGFGKQYGDSVEELIGAPVLELTKGSHVTLHGAGREDIDALMIGTGRPFILEIHNPLVRMLDLKEVLTSINQAGACRVGVNELAWSHRSDVEMLKAHKGHKRYRILVDIDGVISKEELQRSLNKLQNAIIHQRTPKRVSHRRADKVRERMVLEISLLGESERGYEISVLGEAGLYIKELVSGDEGRTNPSLSGILEKPARVIELDVVYVEGT